MPNVVADPYSVVLHPGPVTVKIQHYNAVWEHLTTTVPQLLDSVGYEETVKIFNRRMPKKNFSKMLTVYEGVLEKTPSGEYEGPLDTDQGPLFITGAKDLRKEDLQSLHFKTAVKPMSPSELLHQVCAPDVVFTEDLLCELELTRFDGTQNQMIAPILWKFILANRDLNDAAILFKVGIAVRKYVAIMPLKDMNNLAILLEPTHRLETTVDIELEIAKMIYRNFEIHPPTDSSLFLSLGNALVDMVKSYTSTRVIRKYKFAALASTCIMALIAMKSVHAQDAIRMAQETNIKWFSDIVEDGILRLHKSWSARNKDSAEWLSPRLVSR